MAKKRGRAKQTPADGTLPPRADETTGEGHAESGTSAEAVALGFAEDLGRLLGTTQKKAEEWLGQRKTLAQRLTQIRDAANTYLQQLTGRGDEGAAAPVRARRGRPAGARKAARSATGKRKRAPLSAEARERIAAAQRARWAKQRRAARQE